MWATHLTFLWKIFQNAIKQKKSIFNKVFKKADVNL